MTSMKQIDGDMTSLAEPHETHNRRRIHRDRHDKSDIDVVKCEDSALQKNPLIDNKAKREHSRKEISKAKITNKTHQPSSSKTQPDLPRNKASNETPTEASIASIKTSTRFQEGNLKSGAVDTVFSNAEARQSSKKLPASIGGNNKSKKKEEGRMNVKQYQQSTWQQEVRPLVAYNRQQHGITGMPLHHYNTTASTQYVESYEEYHTFVPFEQRRHQALHSQTMELQYRQPQYGMYQRSRTWDCILRILVWESG